MTFATTRRPAGVGPIRAARIFAGLKARLTRRTLARAGVLGVLGLVISSTAAAVVTLVFVQALLTLRPTNGTAADVGVLAVALVALFGVVAPIAGAGIDDTIAPAKLALLPIRSSSVIAGSIAAALVGPWPIAGVVITGVAVARSTGGSPPAIMIAVVAFPLAVLVAVTAARAVTTGLSLLLRSRHVSEVAALVTLLMIVAIYVVPRAYGDWIAAHLGPVADVVSWTPFGFAPGAVAAAARGEAAGALGRLLLAAATVGALAWIWNAGVSRALTTAESAGRTRTATRTHDWKHPPAVIDFFPTRPWAAVASRVLREYARNPRRRVALLLQCLPGMIIAAAIATSQPSRVAVVVLLSLPAAFVASATQNLFGIDGASLWTDISAGIRPKTVIVGHVAAVGTVAVGALPVVAVVVGAVSGQLALVPFALVGSFGVFLAATGGFAYAAALVPSPLPEEPTNAWTAQDAGRGCLSGIVNLAAIGAGILLGVPSMIATTVALWSPLAAVVALPLAVAWGVFIAWLGITAADHRLAGREPELLRAVSFAGD
ncbi:MAG: hypothetical protein ACOYNI_03735 [Acidimicrobiia bacterium]